MQWSTQAQPLALPAAAQDASTSAGRGHCHHHRCYLGSSLAVAANFGAPEDHYSVNHWVTRTVRRVHRLAVGVEGRCLPNSNAREPLRRLRLSRLRLFWRQPLRLPAT